MSFSFNEAGSRQEVLKSLETQASTITDGLGTEVIDMLDTAIRDGAEPGDGERYVISCSGHGGYRNLVTLELSVKIQPLPPTATDNQMAAETKPVQEPAPADEPVASDVVGQPL